MIEEAVELVVVVIFALALAYAIGIYMTLLILDMPRPFERTLSKIESVFFRLAGIDKNEAMTWRQYLKAFLATNFLLAAFTFIILYWQGMSLDLSFHTASSFATNTNLQHYAGETLPLLSQLSLIVPMFVAPGTAFAAAFAFLRCFRNTSRMVGNFYVDLTRVILTILLPMSFVGAIVLMILGVPQTMDTTMTTGTLDGGAQIIHIGPIASWESIKLFGNNGGGFLGANSASPFENPTGLSNAVEIVMMLSLPLAFPFAYGELFGRAKGRGLLIVIMAPFLVLLAFALSAPAGTEGLETRFGSFGSVFFNFGSISSNTGATNALLIDLPRRPIVSMFVCMFVQAIPGGGGAGFMMLVVYAILTIFLVGLMVGKTPELLGYKIHPKEVKLAVIVFIIHPLLILVPSAIAFASGQAQSILGPHVTPGSYTQVLYEFTSASANNGSDYLGTLANTPFWNISTGIVMLAGRFAPISLMLMIAGQYDARFRRDVPEPIRTDSWAFILTMIAVTLALTALAFLPFLVIGPFVM